MRDSMSCVITPLRFSLSRLSLALTAEKNSASCFSRNSVTGDVAAALGRSHKHKIADLFLKFNLPKAISRAPYSRVL